MPLLYICRDWEVGAWASAFCLPMQLWDCCWGERFIWCQLVPNHIMFLDLAHCCHYSKFLIHSVNGTALPTQKEKCGGEGGEREWERRTSEVLFTSFIPSVGVATLAAMQSDPRHAYSKRCAHIQWSYPKQARLFWTKPHRTRWNQVSWIAVPHCPYLAGNLSWKGSSCFYITAEVLHQLLC